MTEYKKPELEIIELNSDVITTSAQEDTCRCELKEEIVLR